MKRLIIFLALFFAYNCLYAQILEKAQSFYTSNIEIIYQPPLQKSFNSPYQPYKEVPKINRIINIFNGYIQYLKKQGKIAQDIRLLLLYSPELNNEEYDENPRLIKIQSLELNGILEKINEFLSKNKDTDIKFLATNYEKLTAFAQSMNEKANDLTTKLGLHKIEESNNPIITDNEFCIVDEKRIAVIRPTDKNNMIYLLTNTDNGYYTSVLAMEGDGCYKNLSSSPSGQYLAYSNDLKPQISVISTSAIIKPFDANKIILEMKWAPKNNILAGIVLDRITQERTCFIYDADKQKHLLPDLNNKQLPENNLYSYPYWAPNAEKLFFASSQAIHLIDLTSNKVVPYLVRLKDSFAELIWSDDSKSFAITELVGQTRNHAEFDDMDFRKTILHRYKLSEQLEAIEDQAQKIESRRTLRPIGFSPNDRVIYIEGKMSGKRMDNSLWDLSSNCKAYLTPLPSISKEREQTNDDSYNKITELPMQYLYVYRNMNGKQKNIFDAGFQHSNYLYIDKQENTWFVGLPGKGDLQSTGETFNQRIYPYPFLETNHTILTTIPSNKLKKFLSFLENYNLKTVKFSKSGSQIWLLGNFTGPLRLWESKLDDFINGIIQNDKQEVKVEK